MAGNNEESKGRFIIVEWDEKDSQVTEKKLQTFIKANSRSEPVIKFGNHKKIALLEFKDEKDVNFLRNQWKSNTFWEIIKIYGVSETHMVKVSNLQPSATRRDVYRYFTNKNMVRFECDIEIKEEYFNPEYGICVLHMKSADDVRLACKMCPKFKKYRGNALSLEPYYEEIVPMLQMSLNDTDITPVIKDNIDHMKMEFMKEFCKETIEQRFQTLCAHISWAKAQNKVRISFECRHESPSKEHGKEWEKKVNQLLQDILTETIVIRKNCTQDVWSEVQTVLQRFPSSTVLVDVDPDQYRVIIVGRKDDKFITDLEKEIDAIQPPKPLEKKEIKSKDKIKLVAFADLAMSETIEGVTVECRTDAGVIKVEGDKETIDEAEIEILQILNQIKVKSSEINSKHAANILITPLMRDKIEASKDDQGQRCGYLIEKNVLHVFSIGISDSELNQFRDSIKALIIEKTIILEGKVENERILKTEVKKIEDQYSPYVVLDCKISKEKSEIHIVCGQDYYGPVCDDLNEKVATLLVTTDDIEISPYVVKYIQKKLLESIRNKIKNSGHPSNILENNTDKGKFKVKGNAAVRQKVIAIVQEEAKKIHASWRHIEEEGIHDYFADGDGVKFLTNEKEMHRCDLRIATQYEMKEEDIHCIVLLETGQALFVGTGSLTDPQLPVDVIVNAANSQLDHKGGLAADILKAGGKTIQDDCTDFIKKNGELEPGDIYVGTAGILPCQRIIHAVGPKWKGGHNGEDDVLQTVVKNILEAMNQDKDFILRSVALPLISAGVFGFPRPQAAKIILQTVHDNLKANKNVREIFFYDPNPDAVRKIQKQMQGIFGEKCFHLPVRNIGVGKGTMSKPALTGVFNIKRSGSRTLPLPSGAKFKIQWGELHTTAVEILVNATPTAPRPSGNVSDALKYATGVGFDMESECSKEFRKINPDGNVENGTLISTRAGRIPCSDIYHIKIEASWNKSKGCNSLAGYIRTCLNEAVRQKRSSIAFPTIGTTDCGYPQDEVATVFIRTIGEFMQSHLTCSLRKILVVINKSDLIATSAFEVILEQIYSQRPHRLLADIKEKLAGARNNIQRTPQTPPLKRPVSAIHKPKAQSNQDEGSFVVEGSGGVNVDLKVGNIENAKADAIVCTSSSFPTLNGAIANAISKAGGSDIKNECKKCYKGYPNKGVAVTKAGNLSCKKVFYIVLKDYVPANAKTIYESVHNCLEQAEKEKLTSIAMSTFGTGGFKYPDQVSADQMFKAIKDFFKQKRSHVKLIVIVMYGPAQQTCQVFSQKAANFFTRMKAPTSVPADVKKVNFAAENGDLWKVPNTSTSLEVTYGNLELAKADVILDTTTSFPNLNGIIPDSLCKRAGPQLKQECHSFKGNVSSGMIVETKGYDLDCQQVYHYFMPNWTEANGEQTISNCIDDCLQKMKKGGLTSIAIPSIGSGGAKYNPKKVAHGIYRAASDFGTSNTGVKCHINLVLYPAAKEVNKTFVDELQVFIKGGGGGKANKQKSKGVTFADDGAADQPNNDNDIVIPKKRRDFVLIQFISDDTKNVDVAFQSIKAQVSKETRQKSIELKKDKHYDDVDLLTADNAKHKKMIEQMGVDYHVKVVVDTTSRKITLRGIGNGVIKCYERILQYLHDRRKEVASINIGKIVYQTIEWYYTEDNEKIWVPYPGHIKYLLEDAFITKATTKEFRDINGKIYEVNFTKMEEYLKEKKESASTIKVIRKDLTEGTVKALPLTWQGMPESENLKEHTLKPTDQEYKDVEANFKQTLDGYQVTMIKEIRRIQNRTLYQQYQTKKEQLELEHGNSLQIERTLWHGTQEDKEKSITFNGFNRSYAGSTFQGKVWYGMGVYFAVRSSYSTSPFYSPPDANGIKRMYQVKVLTGQTTDVPQGYKERYAPLVPGSDIDRYNSTCDSSVNPTEFVIFNDTQAYPEYIILFK